MLLVAAAAAALLLLAHLTNTCLCLVRGEQKLILHNEALTANLVDIYLRALEVKYLPSSP